MNIIFYVVVFCQKVYDDRFFLLDNIFILCISCRFCFVISKVNLYFKVYGMHTLSGRLVLDFGMETLHI